MSTPSSHLVESQKLTADALVDLYQIQLRSTPVVFRFKQDNTVVWQGITYEGWPCKMSGDSRTADGEESRPILQIMNPAGIFNVFAKRGQLDLATVIRRRFLLRDLESNGQSYEQRMWYVGRVREVISGQSLSLELRNKTEGPNFQIPVRMYIPPQFPLVSL